MNAEPFWYVDDEHHVRWAVRVCGEADAGPRRIVFTSRDQQISSTYPLDKEQSRLTRYEILELLAQAKAETIGGWAA